MLEIWKGAYDNSKAFTAFLADILKVFDCLSQ